MAARLFVLVDAERRRRAADYVLHRAQDGYEVLITEPRMNDGQRARFHAMCRDFALSGIEWAGAERTAAEWKVLLISGHAQATGSEVELIRGLEGEMVNVRESTATMARGRGASLIDYATAHAVGLGVRLRDTRDNHRRGD